MTRFIMVIVKFNMKKALKINRFLAAAKKAPRGSALIIALMVMGVIIAVSLVLSTLIFRETRLMADAINSGKAYFAAESGVEMALLGLNNNLPGWSTVENHQYQIGEIKGDFAVSNTCNAYPCFDGEFDYKNENIPLAQFYDILDLNESITIPLFTVDQNGNEVKVKNFTVEFYTPFDVNEHLNVADNFEIFGWDVLRWKIFGKYNPSRGSLSSLGLTETISDFTAVSKQQQSSVSVNNVTAEINFGQVARYPSWLGTLSCSSLDGADRYTDQIECIRYGSKNVIDLKNTVNPDQEAALFAGICDNTEAREYYKYDGNTEMEVEDIKQCYPIKEFLDNHSLNYLSLTNLMNPSVFREKIGPDLRLILSRLFFRVELFGDADNPRINNQTVREFASIKANGYSGNLTQTVEVKKRRGSFMPVFNFSLYSTSKNK